eukprot:Nk52_evm30s271 gene=Nk52_evmTU30s271
MQNQNVSVPSLTEVMVYTSESVVRKPNPTIPLDLKPEEGKELKKDLNICAVELRSLIQCSEKMKTDAFCQEQFREYVSCKNDRNVKLEERISKLQEKKYDLIKRDTSKAGLERKKRKETFLMGNIEHCEQAIAGNCIAIDAPMMGGVMQEAVGAVNKDDNVESDAVVKVPFCSQMRYELQRYKDWLNYLSGTAKSIPPRITEG